MPNPSLLIVPARFKTGRLYSQIPSNTDNRGDFNVTRATTATRVNASGYIESVASGIPRLDYFASGGVVGCPALLVEPSGSNSVLRSQDFSATWAATVSATVTGVTSPDGTANASIFIADSTSNRVRQSVSLVSGTTYTYSLFGKFDALSSGFTMNVFEENTTAYGSGVCQAFNLNEGTLGASGSVGAGFTLQSAGMENYGNGWYRCRMTVLMGYTTPSGATGGRVGFRIGTQIQSGRPLSVVSGSVSAWGAQLETGSVATSYIPTTTGQVTRNADVVSVSGAVSGSIGQTEGTIYAEVDIRNLTNADSVRIVSLTTTTNSNNFIEITKRSSTQLRCDARLNSGSTITFLTVSGFVLGVNKIAFAYQDGNYAMAINGAVTTSAQAGMTSSLNTIILGAAASNIAQFNDRIRAVALYTTRLTNTELAALTT